jgi:hypothetical protein
MKACARFVVSPEPEATTVPRSNVAGLGRMRGSTVFDPVWDLRFVKECMPSIIRPCGEEIPSVRPFAV